MSKKRSEVDRMLGDKKWNNKRSWVHLHLHSDYSMLDGLGTIEEYVSKAKKLGHPAMAITDHGSVMGAPEFYWTCREADIEPILGEEFYFAPNAEKAKADKDQERFHVTILANSREGFATLSELSEAAHARFYGKPLLERSLLESLSRRERNGLVVLSGCAGSIISQKSLFSSSMESTLEETLWWDKLFPNFRMELMHHDTAFDRKLNTRLAKIGRKLDIPWVITNDPHYVYEKECDTHDALLAIQTASDVDDPDRFRFDGAGYHLRSRRELEEAFSVYPREIWEEGRKETLSIARSCRIRIPSWDNRSWHIPKWRGSDDGSDAFRELRRLARRGLRDRGLEQSPAYVAAAKHELKEFKKVTIQLEDHEVGMADFLLITRDAIQAAKEKGIRVGPGRGSTCGSVVAWLIGLHKIDPIKYDLLFERFLNPERPKMPDVDTDFQASRRDEMFQWAREEYGKENVVPVAAFGTLQTKRAFQSLARAYGISDYGDRLRLSNEIVEDEEGNAILPSEIRKNYPEIVEALNEITGVKGSLSSHAAGIIIFDPADPVRETVPMQWIPPRSGAPGRWVGQFNLAATEKLYLMKEDFLALRALDTIEECLRLIRERHAVKIEPDDWVPDEEKDDKKLYRMLTKGDCHGIFQMEGGANFQGIQKIRPVDFEGIVTCTSLYRKGPMEAGAVDRFLTNKKDKKIRTPHPKLKPYLEKSWGEMIYQEQMFRILNELAGLSWARVDDVKTAMTKKDPNLMRPLRDETVRGLMETSDIPESVAIEIWENIEHQTGYLFNRCATGDTLIYRSNYTASSGQTISLEELYRIWHGARQKDLAPNERSLRSAYRRRGLSIKAYVGGAIRRAKVKDIYCNGVRDVWKVTLANGMSIKTTGNHRHLAEHGWARTDTLAVGQSLVTDSGKYARPSLHGAHRRNGTGSGWAGKTEQRMLYTDGRMGPSQGGHVAGLRKVTALLPDLCERCGETEGRLERAHLDGDRTNNSRENVLRLCNPCHKKHDWDTGQRVKQYAHGYLAELSEIVSIESAGVEVTYDLEMNDPSHNFVANGIVTHNSHAVAYSILTYQTARLKMLYPLEYIAALLRTVKPTSNRNKEKRKSYLNDAIKRGFNIEPPDVNVSDAGFLPHGEDTLLFGLADIKGVGEKTITKVIAAREQAKGKWFNKRTQVDTAINNVSITSKLALAGAFRNFGVEPDVTQQEELLSWQFTDRMADYREKYAKHIKLPATSNGFCSIPGEIVKVEKRTTKDGRPWRSWTIRHAPGEEYKITLWEDTIELWGLCEGSVIIVRGKWDQQWKNIAIGDPDNVKVLSPILKSDD